MITRTLAGLVLAAHLAAGLLPTALERREASAPMDKGPAIHLERRTEIAPSPAFPRSCERLPLETRRPAALPPAPETPATSRLVFCPEFTKPDYLKLRLSATPQSYRSPPV